MPVPQVKLGWVPDVPDFRDFRFSVAQVTIQSLPNKVDLSPKCPPVWDQGKTGSCTAQAIGAAFEFQQMQVKPAWDFRPSALFIYYNERMMEGNINVDSGAMIRTGMKTIQKYGVCKDPLWPYVESKFKIRPPAVAYKNGLTHRGIAYERLQTDLTTLKGCLAGGYPFVFGFAVYQSLMTDAVAESGDGKMPLSNDKMLGGHAVMAVGYDDATRTFLIRNSWSDKWGKKGYFTLPYEYLTNSHLADDFWVLRKITNNPAIAK